MIVFETITRNRIHVADLIRKFEVDQSSPDDNASSVIDHLISMLISIGHKELQDNIGEEHNLTAVQHFQFLRQTLKEAEL